MKKISIFIVLFIMFTPVYAKEKVEFSSCTDGDTFKIIYNNEVKTVRLLAVDTPESVHPKKEVEYYGKEASDYTCNVLKKANKIELEFDENSDKLDKYDRLLAWVFIDDKLLQESLIEGGYAKVAYLYGNYKYTTKLQELQEIASNKNIGVWDEEAKENFNPNQNEDKITTIEIIILFVILIIIMLFGTKKQKKKILKKVKKYKITRIILTNYTNFWVNSNHIKWSKRRKYV